MDYRRPQNNRIEHKTINRKSILLILSPFKRVTELDVAKGSSIFLFTISFRVTLLYAWCKLFASQQTAVKFEENLSGSELTNRNVLSALKCFA